MSRFEPTPDELRFWDGRFTAVTMDAWFYMDEIPPEVFEQRGRPRAREVRRRASRVARAVVSAPSDGPEPPARSSAASRTVCMYCGEVCSRLCAATSPLSDGRSS